MVYSLELSSEFSSIFCRFSKSRSHVKLPHIRLRDLPCHNTNSQFTASCINSTQLNFIVKQARGSNKNKEKERKENITKKHKKHTQKYAQRVSHTYKSLRHFASRGERQKRSQLTKAWVISLLHEHNERSSENCCLRTAAKKVIAPRWTNNWLALHQVGIFNKNRKALLKATCIKFYTRLLI